MPKELNAIIFGKPHKAPVLPKGSGQKCLTCKSPKPPKDITAKIFNFKFSNDISRSIGGFTTKIHNDLITSLRDVSAQFLLLLWIY